MARYLNIDSIVNTGGSASCYMNGRLISVIDDEVYVDGVLYVPASNRDKKAKRPPVKEFVDHKFDVSSSFSAIYSKGFFDVVFTQSDNPSDFDVHGNFPKELIDKIEISVLLDTLCVTVKSGSYDIRSFNGKKPTLFITNKQLKKVDLSGTGDISIKGDLNVVGSSFSLMNSGTGSFRSGKINVEDEMLFIMTSGSGNINIHSIESKSLCVNLIGSGNVTIGSVKTTAADIEIKGSGNVNVSGSSDIVMFSIAGSGTIRARNLKAKNGRALVSGSGDIQCNVTRLSEKVRGSGDIENIGEDFDIGSIY